MSLATYNFSTFGPAETLQLQIEAGGFPIRERQFLIAATLFASSSDEAPRVSPGELSWQYSHNLDTNFTYLPKTDGLTPIRLLRALSSTTPFTRVRLDILEWAKPTGTQVPRSAFGRLLFGVRSSSDIPALQKRPVIYGVVAADGDTA